MSKVVDFMVVSAPEPPVCFCLAGEDGGVGDNVPGRTLAEAMHACQAAACASVHTMASSPVMSPCSPLQSCSSSPLGAGKADGQ